MSPHEHSILHKRDFGGETDDYDKLNQFIDSSKLYFPLPYHRMFSHNTFFISICERVFGMYITNSDGIEIPVRILCEEHIKQDHNGVLPTLQDWVKELKITLPGGHKWINNPRKKDLEYLKDYYDGKSNKNRDS